ncbi:MAG TPA: serine/threonine protein phosphatase, partial [Clostridiaceae bacterium]|nr:serine/threonine protein phosphatase [Clostridiaceae bacterium]
MARLVIKNGYLKGGKAASHLNHLVKYIATREGVEKVSNAKALWHSTKKQQSLISQIIREFPDSKE